MNDTINKNTSAPIQSGHADEEAIVFSTTKVAEEIPVHLAGEAKKIMCFLAKNGPTNIYQVSKGTHGNYPTTHEIMKKLEKWKILRFECEKNSEKGGKSKVYGLTLLGLCYVFWSGELLDILDDIIEKWKHLDALLLPNWKHLISTGRREEAVEALKPAAANVWYYACMHKPYETGAIKNDEDIQPILWNEFSGRLIGIHSDYDRQKWIEAIRSVPILNDWMKEYYEKSRSYQQSLVVWDNRVLKLLKGEKAALKGVEEQLKKTWYEYTRMQFKNASEEFMKTHDMGVA